MFRGILANFHTDMLRFLDLSYNTFKGKSLEQAIARAKPSFQYLPFLKQHFQNLVILHTQEERKITSAEADYQSFKGKSGFFWVPAQTNKHIAAYNPDVVLAQGLIFPFQVILLRWRLGKKPVIVVQHHGEQPAGNSIKRFFQRWADKHIDGYFFTSLANADIWVEAGVISNKAKCHEILEASTDITAKDKKQATQKLGVSGEPIFLWVGRLNANKDPLTVLEAFEQYIKTQPCAKLYMIYQSEELLGAIKQRLNAIADLRDAVVLVGQVAHEDLADWYSAADFYISASHREGSGYALLEAIACGCIPVVTDIPSFRTMTAEGRYAYLYKPGNADDLLRVLHALPADTGKFSGEVIQHFSNKLTAQAIGENIYAAFKQLLEVKK